jgi:nitrogen-specific signal transduction histidine kinase
MFAVVSVLIDFERAEGNSEIMSAATQAILIETAPYLETMTSLSPSEDDLRRELIHELRQPLSSIEAIAYYLEMTLPPEQIQARLYMRRLQELVDQTSSLLEGAAAGVRQKVAGVA